MVQYFATVLVIYTGNDETYDSLEHHSGTVRELFNDPPPAGADRTSTAKGKKGGKKGRAGRK